MTEGTDGEMRGEMAMWEVCDAPAISPGVLPSKTLQKLPKPVLWGFYGGFHYIGIMSGRGSILTCRIFSSPTLGGGTESPNL